MSIISRFNTLLRKPAYKEIHNYADKHIKIDWNLPTDSFNKIYEAKDTIANYAKSHKADIKIYSGTKLLSENDTEAKANLLKDCIIIEASKKNTPTELLYVKEQPEKPFIRNVYESLQKLFNEESPLKQHIKETRERLNNYKKNRTIMKQSTEGFN